MEVTKSKYDEKALALVPPALREFYREYTTANFPFGEVYSIETAVEDSREEPLWSQGWFVFGFDRYFSYWLCRLTPDESSLSFTSWDHDVREIDGAVYRHLDELLASEQEEYERDRNIGTVVLESLPGSKLSFIAKLRSAFSLTISSRELMKALDSLPYDVMAASKINSTLSGDYWCMYGGTLFMAAYFIVNIEIQHKDDRKSYDEYIAKVKPIVERHGGKYLVRSEQVTLLAGDQKPDRIIVIQFESRQQLDACFASPEYVAVKGLREMSVKANAFIVEQ